jgi:hypothetical protein
VISDLDYIRIRIRIRIRTIVRSSAVAAFDLRLGFKKKRPKRPKRSKRSQRSKKPPTY